MKKLLLTSVLAFATLGTVTSCSSDRDEPTTTQTPKYAVSGTWDFTQYYDTTWEDMSMLKYYITIKSDNTYTTNYLGTNDSGTYTYDNADMLVLKSNISTNNIRIVSMTSTDAQIEMYNNSNPSDVAKFKLKRR